MRYSELKRMTPLKRTGFKAKVPGPAAATLRTSSLKPYSARRRKVNAERRKLAADHLDEPCRLRTPVCTGWAEHFHELVGRSQGGSLTDRRNLVPSCDRCNGWVEDHPTDAYEAGWKFPGASAIPGDRGLVPPVASPLSMAANVGDAA